jgi:hypothetical protein
VTNLDDAPEVWISQAPVRGHWLAIRARLPLAQRDAEGALAMLEVDGRTQIRRITRGGSYLTSSQGLARFGLGAAPERLRLTMLWPDGSEEAFDVAEFDLVLDVEKGAGKRP